MKLFLVLVSLLATASSQAATFKRAERLDLNCEYTLKSGKTGTLSVDGRKGKVVDSVELPEAGVTLSLESYFMRYQIHMASLETGENLLSTSVPDTTTDIRASSAEKGISIFCSQKN